MMPITLSHIRQLSRQLSAAQNLEKYSKAHRLAAVLVLIFPGHDDLEIILTRRSEALPNHAGQISFPGGTVETSDRDTVYTALREASEEIALDGNVVEIVGSLEVITLPSGFAVAPILGIAEKRPALIANPDEVDDVFSIPLSIVSDLTQYNMDSLVRDGIERDFYYLNYGDYYIWGATARMLMDLALLLDQSSDD